MIFFISSAINKLYRSLIYNTKILLKLSIRINNDKLRTALVIQDINIYSYSWLQKLKIKYKMSFKEKLTFYDKKMSMII